MKTCVCGYETRTPRNLADAVRILADEPGRWRLLAGGTDVMVLLGLGKLVTKRLLSIWHLEELRGTRVEDDRVTLGALTTCSDLLRHSLIRSEFPLVATAAGETSGVAIQNRATLGGNIMNASPAADNPPALLVYEAEVELTSIRGSRWMPYQSFHTGYKRTRMAADELLTRIRLPRPVHHFQGHYRKVGARRGQAISKVCFAGLRDCRTGEVRIAFGGVAPVPLRCLETEAAVRQGKSPFRALSRELSPIDDLRSSAAYRLRVAQNLMGNFLFHGC